MPIKDYIAVHIRKDKWWLLRPPFMSSSFIPDTQMMMKFHVKSLMLHVQCMLTQGFQ